MEVLDTLRYFGLSLSVVGTLADRVPVFCRGFIFRIRGVLCCGICFFFLDCFQDWVGDHLEFQRLVEEFAPRDFDTVYFAANCVLMPSNSLVYVHVIFSNHCLGVDVILVRRFRCQFETR